MFWKSFCFVYYIDSEIEFTRDTILRTEAAQEPREVIIAKYKETYATFKRLSVTFVELGQTLKHIDTALKIRKKGFHQMRGSICRTIRHNFCQRLQTRGYYGKLVFDHDDHSTQMLVNPNMDTTGSTADQ